MVILAMNVSCDGTSDADEFRTRGHREEESFWDRHVNDLGQGDTRFTTQDTVGLVQSQKMIQAGMKNDPSVLIQREPRRPPAS